MAPSSPLHASFSDNRRSTHHHTHSNPSYPQHDRPALSPLLPGSGRDTERSGSPRDSPAASTSTSRQTRRLQLRNAGFQAAAIPARNVTPTQSLPSISTSTNWSSIPSLQQSSDAENVSPSGRRARDSSPQTSGYANGSTRDSSGGVLQDIGNSATLRQTKRARARVTSGKFWAGESKDASLMTVDDIQSPPSNISNTGRARSVRTRAKMPRASRRSVSAETRKYVDHLEQQLVEAQEQLAAATSPSHTREQSNKMRHLNAESKHLQEELAAWETRYEERVQEELDKHFRLEAELRSQVRTMETEAEASKYKIDELEMQLEESQQHMDAVETANVNLEKRLEIMSELLAASPNKIDLHAETPGRRRHGRPKSMMPRFPTAGSLAISPERQSQTQPTSPSPSHASVRFSPGAPISPVNLSFSPEVTSDDDDCAQSDASMSMSSVIHAPSGTKKPMRRMRRFGAGSMGPKPLILPSTSHCEQLPFSAPPRENSEEPAFPFHSDDVEADSSPRSVHHRASSVASPKQANRQSRSNFMTFESPMESIDAIANDPGLGSPPPARLSLTAEDMLGLELPASRLSLVTNATRDLSSMGSGLTQAAGRNLMEELTAMQSRESDGDIEGSSDPPEAEEDDPDLPSSPFNSDVEDGPPQTTIQKVDGHASPPINTNGRLRSASTAALDSTTAVSTVQVPIRPQTSHSRSSSRSIGIASSHSPLSTLDSLRTIFSNMFQSPVELAKHLIQTAQTRMYIPGPLLNVQWWLVGVLLGPMARKRRLLAASRKDHSSSCCSPNPRQHSILDDPVPPDESTADSPSDSPLAYGTVYRTPDSSASESAPSRNRSLVAGKGKKRKSLEAPACPDHPRRSKHSPLLWLKFSMTLAIAVGVAFRDGPRSLLMEKVCECRIRQGREKQTLGRGISSAGVGVGSIAGGAGNWRRARRDEGLPVTPGGEG